MAGPAPEPLDEQTFDSLVEKLIVEAQGFTNRVLRPARIDAWRDFHGMGEADPIEDGSDVVMTEVRDTVLAMMPSLMELFCGTDTICEYYSEGTPSRLPPLQQVPGAEQRRMLAEQASRFATALFWEKGGWRMVHDGCEEALVACLGVWKAHRRIKIEVERFDVQLQNPLDLASLEGSEDIVLEQVEKMSDQLGAVTAARAAGRRYYALNELALEAVPASDVIVSQSINADVAALVGEVRQTTYGDLARLGVDPEKLQAAGLAEYLPQEQERVERRQYTRWPADGHGHWSLMPTTAYELYCRIDADGDGLPEVWKVIAIGPGRTVVHRELVEEQPYVLFSAYIIPHEMQGRGVATMTSDLQHATTQMVRGLIDNMEAINDPLVIAARNTDQNALASWRREKIVREAIPGSTRFLTVPSIIGDAVDALEVMDRVRESRTGQSRVSQGLDPDALQNTREAAVIGTLGASQSKLEFLCRNIAETGLKPLFKKLLRLMREEPPRRIQMPQGYAATVDPKSFDPAWGVRAVVGLGQAKRQELRQVYQNLFMIQAQIIGKLGPDNPLCSLVHVALTLRNWLNLYPGIRPEECFGDPMAVMQALQQKAGQPPPPDPKVQAEQAKAQAQAQTAAQKLQLAREQAATQAQIAAGKAQADLGLKYQEQAADADIARQQLANETWLKALELALAPEPQVARPGNGHG